MSHVLKQRLEVLGIFLDQQAFRFVTRRLYFIMLDLEFIVSSAQGLKEKEARDTLCGT